MPSAIATTSPVKAWPMTAGSPRHVRRAMFAAPCSPRHVMVPSVRTVVADGRQLDAGLVERQARPDLVWTKARKTPAHANDRHNHLSGRRMRTPSWRAAQVIKPAFATIRPTALPHLDHRALNRNRNADSNCAGSDQRREDDRS